MGKIVSARCSMGMRFAKRVGQEVRVDIGGVQDEQEKAERKAANELHNRRIPGPREKTQGTALR
jgi:hypothetical protein